MAAELSSFLGLTDNVQIRAHSCTPSPLSAFDVRCHCSAWLAIEGAFTGTYSFSPPWDIGVRRNLQDKSLCIMISMTSTGRSLCGLMINGALTSNDQYTVQSVGDEIYMMVCLCVCMLSCYL